MDIFCQDTKLNLSARYLRPGMSFGGSCLPKDVRAMTHQARSNDVDVPLVANLTATNETHLARAVKLILDTGAREVAILGLSFKAGTDDLREAPMVEVAERLLGKGLKIRIYDRNVSLARLTGANARFIHEHLPHIGELLVDDLDDAIDGAEVVVFGNGDPSFAEVAGRLDDEIGIVDLVRGGGRRLRPPQLPGTRLVIGRWLGRRRGTNRDDSGSDRRGDGPRVVIVVQNLPVPFDRRVWLEATTLAANGYQVTCICPTGKGHDARFEIIEGVRIHRYPIPVDAAGPIGFVVEFAWLLRPDGHEARA